VTSACRCISSISQSKCARPWHEITDYNENGSKYSQASSKISLNFEKKSQTRKKKKKNEKSSDKFRLLAWNIS
jgi:hypothetical protein